MKISYNWLKKYLAIDLPAEEVSVLLTDCGLEVEAIEKYEQAKGGLTGVVVGQVMSCAPHPNADKLSLTKVDVGKGELLNVVCGAPNVAKGQKVAVATVGTTLFSGGEAFLIKISKIRGELSEGMICAEDELGLGNSHAGIMVLDSDAPVGMPVKEYFKLAEDIVFEIGLTPNRSDATSHIGVARDLAAVLNNKPGNSYNLHVEIPSIAGFKADNDNLLIPVTVEDRIACPRYSGITLQGVEVKESPAWLQELLKAIGVRPINNIVDITNFILFETGQPLHAFDVSQITGKKVIVKKLPEGSRFITLDEVERKLSANDLMICNSSEGMCIAGVFGGSGSGIKNTTRDIFIESAYFDPTSVRKTSKYHGLKTDASFRFERGADPNITVYALKRAAMLIREIAGGEISSQIVDVYQDPVPDKEVVVTYKGIDKLIGKEIDHVVIKNILTDLGITITDARPDGLTLSVPPFKADVYREVDIVEEILRIYGYNNVEFTGSLRSSLSFSPHPDRERLSELAFNYLSDNGFNEIMTNSLTTSAYYAGSEVFKPEYSVKILNPLSKELDVMRQTLLFSGLESILYNINHRLPDLRLYELGSTYLFNPKHSDSKDVNLLYTENKRLAIYMTGRTEPESWNTSQHKSDYFSLKSYVMNLLHKLGIAADKLKVDIAEPLIFSSGESFSFDGKNLMTIGDMSTNILRRFDIRQPVYFADINWDMIVNLSSGGSLTYRDVPKFPEVRRDLALLIDKQIHFSAIERLAFENSRQLLRKVNLFDVYEGDKIDSDKKSYAVSFILQDENRTLTDKEIDKFMNRLIEVYERELKAIIRR
jgi:phenylalanyl-tRNA synthetase beta chain